MNEDKIILSRKELELAEREAELVQPDYSDDDLASSLGFMTSISEKGMNPEGETDMQEEDPEEGVEGEKQPQDESKPEDVDSAQTKEIDSIKSEIEAIRAELATLEGGEGATLPENGEEPGKDPAA